MGRSWSRDKIYGSVLSANITTDGRSPRAPRHETRLTRLAAVYFMQIRTSPDKRARLHPTRETRFPWSCAAQELFHHVPHAAESSRDNMFIIITLSRHTDDVRRERFRKTSVCLIFLFIIVIYRRRSIQACTWVSISSAISTVPEEFIKIFQQK